jgi:LPXTG-motif cell wall-anchored protein
MSPARDHSRVAIAAGLIGGVLADAMPALSDAPAGDAPAGDAAAMADIRDIRLPGGSETGAYLALLGLGLAALVGVAYLVWRRRRRAPLRSYETALQQLEAARSLLRAERANEYCVAVSCIVRRYIEAGFRIPVTQRTTEEFLFNLAGRVDTPLARHRARLEDFLHRCDAAKFGGSAPTAPVLESLHRSAADFVRETTAEAHDAVSAT